MILLGIFVGLLLCALPVQILPKASYEQAYWATGREPFASGYAFVRHLLTLSATPLFDVFLAMLAVALVMATWAMFPMVLAEAFPHRLRQDAAARLGNWLDNGFQLLGYAGRTVFVAVVLVLPVGAGIAWYVELNRPAGTSGDDPRLLLIGLKQEPWVLASASAVVATPAVLLLLLQSRKLTLGLRSVLDIALDVDNHLRVRPLDCTPRAQIAARYASLLRYVCRWTDPEDGGRYD